MRRALLAALAALVVAPSALGAPPPTRWCGTPTAEDRPDAVAGFQFHVVYAVPADAPDRFEERVLPIARDLAAVDGWWRAQDANRTPRFDLFADPGCDTDFGRLDVASIRLPESSGHFAADSFNRLRPALASVLIDPDKKYLVFYDGPVDNRRICGTSALIRGDDVGGPDAVAAVWLGSLCADDLGAGQNAATTAVHEMIHNMGALPRGAPNACPDDDGHPCDEPNDILYPFASNQPLNAVQLDFGRDDYYGHAGAWPDVQDSPFLDRLLEPDTAAPAGPAQLTATSLGRNVTVSWDAASDDAGPVRYRVYRNGGVVVGSTDGLTFENVESPAETIEYGVRARDAAGRLGPKLTVRFTVGLGIVDASGALVRDTVPPPAVGGLRVVRRTRTQVVLGWRGVSDPGGLRGYRLTRNGRAVATVTGTSLRVARRRAPGVWRVRAVDRGGNLGPVRATLRVR